MKLDNFIVYENDSVVQVMSKINDNARGIIFVCDREKHLVAAVSDGDVRRYIINKGDLNSPVSVMANYQCMSIFANERVNAHEIMEKNCISGLPVVDQDNIIIDIEFLLYKKEEIKNKINQPVVIMAGGKGTRLKPYTDILPKPLIPIGSQTITEHIMDHFEMYGCTEFYMIVNYMKNFIKSYFSDQEIKRNVTFIDEEEFLGTGGGIRLLKDRIKDTFFLSNCDIIVEADYHDILKMHKDKKNIITMVCAKNEITVPYGTIITDEHQNIIGMEEKPKISTNVNTGFYIIEPEFIYRIPENRKIDITDIIQSCINSHDHVGCYIIEENQWMDMGQMDQLEKMRERICL